ncbi:P-loop containing nucleoside triphosphate hydrolase protein [Flagelloscypha sp. PMI_526]|nr:P-loop containing nucleoside triphosphate hydrolase protein [Flagelloscypha sp. PMI_526]
MYFPRRSNLQLIPKQKDGDTLFDLSNSKVRHTKYGIWDEYSQALDIPLDQESTPKQSSILRYIRWPKLVPNVILGKYYQIQDLAPHIKRMVSDVSAIPSAGRLLSTYVGLQIALSLIPAVRLWFSGQMLQIVHIATIQRRVDLSLLWKVVLGQFACDGVTSVLSTLSNWVAGPLHDKINSYYRSQAFRVKARFDVPTFEDPSVQRKLDNLQEYPGGQTSIVFECLTMAVSIGGEVLRLVTQVTILSRVLKGQPDGILLAGLSFINCISPYFDQFFGSRRVSRGPTHIWAATTTNRDFILLRGITMMIGDLLYRKELVAGGNVLGFLLEQYERCVTALGEDNQDFLEAVQKSMKRDYSPLYSWFWSGLLGHLPHLVLVYRAIQYPASIPVSVAGLDVINTTVMSFSHSAFMLIRQYGSMTEVVDGVKTLHEAETIPNKVVDGLVPFEVNEISGVGIELEFKEVSFSYPGSDRPVLDNVSFRIGKGQLCVIVGSNGSGKSTVLKLIARIYDPSSGQILLNGLDLQTLKLEDVRKSMSVLFQDYSHFPLSIRDNIGLGDPEHFHDHARIEEAARLGGADTVIEKLPEGLDTYLEPPVLDYYSQLPEGTTTIFGKKVSYDTLRHSAHMKTARESLSGGQMQRIAIAKTFMRSLSSRPTENVGLLLFDEPSAALDPVAEYELFQRLKQLRGNKSMLFSSHRFGNLTKHADLILYMDDAKVIESGQHEELLEKDGAYAHIWKISTEAFLA